MNKSTKIFKPALVVLLLLLAVGLANAIKVGIGTTSPDYKLDVAGPVNLNDGITSGIALRVNGTEALWYNGDYFSWGFGGNKNYFADPVGIGTTSPQATRLDLHGGGFDNLYVWRNTQTGSAYGMGTLNSTLALYTGSHSIAFGKNTGTGTFSEEWMRIKNGKVGIGTAAPSDELHVDGGTTLTVTRTSGRSPVFAAGTAPNEFIMGYVTEAGDYVSGSSVGDSFLFASSNTGTTTIGRTTGNVGIISIDNAAGRVGIGTTTLTGSKVTIESNNDGAILDHLALKNTGTSTGSGADMIFYVGDDQARVRFYKRAADAASVLRLYIGGTSGIYLQDNGNVGIGTSTPAYDLDVAGAAHASSHPTSSDIRLKKDIVEVTNALDKLSRVRGVYFDWNEKYEDMGRATEGRQIGVIAQELEKEFPELVTTWGDLNYRAVDYGRLTGVLIEAIHELKSENESLKEIICLEHPNAEICKQ